MFGRVTARRAGGLVVLLGVIGALISLFADTIGLGHNVLIYGRYQFIGTALGLILIVLGTSVILMDHDPS